MQTRPGRVAWAAGCLLILAVSAGAVDSFEENTTGWASTGGEVSCSGDHWKLGEKSLRWDFTPGATLTRAADADLEGALASRNGGVILWVYCEKPLNGVLQVRAGTWAFPINLGFKGWRAAWVLFSEDARKADPVEGLQFTSPDCEGTIFLDAVAPGNVPWHRQGDAQIPYTNPARTGGKYWYTVHEVSGTEAPPAGAAADPEELQACEEIARRYEQWMFGGLDDPREAMRMRMAGVQAYIARGWAAFDKLGLRRQGDTVTGPGAFCLGEPGRLHLTAEVLEPIALPLAYDAAISDSARAREAFLDVIDYAHDQGWADGSTMGTRYGDPLRMGGYVHAVYVLRDFLREQGRLDRELATIRYQTGFNDIYREPEHQGESADEIRTVLLHRLLAILMEDDSPAKLRDLHCWQRWANSALEIAPGYGDTLKPDGTVFHHYAAYCNGYGNNALLMGSLVYWLLHDTPLALSPEAGQNLKRSLLALRFMAGQHQFPFGVNGRWPFDAGYPLVETGTAYAYLADALDDQELGAAFARLWDPGLPIVRETFPRCAVSIYWCDSPGSLPWLLDQRARYQPEQHPQGHQAFPYAAMSFHRRRQWVASVRGWSKYVWNYEAAADRNRYGRYSSYGTVQIFARGEPVDRDSSGYRERGWDWLRPPGATVIRVPLEDLYERKDHERGYTREPFVGGVALEGRDGLWAMNFADPHFDKSFRFRKSAFFVDETIVCLGSGITNSDAEHPTETVLYQTALNTRPEPFPASSSQAETWLLDPAGNGYYFPDPQVVERRAGRQESVWNYGPQKSEGDFAVAWLDHGRAPADAGYAYAIRPDTTEQGMQVYAAAPDFEVLRRDDAAHIVRFPGQRIVGYALFAAAVGLSHDALAGADAPCLVMTRREGDRLFLAVADPDLRLGPLTVAGTYTPGAEGKLRLRLNGDWEVERAPETARRLADGALEITCRDGATCEVTLRAR